MSTPRAGRAPIDIEPERFREIGHRLVDEVAGLLASMRDRPVTPGETPAEVRRALDAEAPLPEKGSEPGRLIEDAASLLFRHSLFNGHPRFWGYITASAAPIGVLGDFLASAVNANVGAWKLSPAATEIEAQAVRWIAELIGYPRGDGILVSGGNMANFVGFLAARAAKAGPGIRARGLAAPGARPLRVYASDQTHTWIQKAADLFGLGTESIRWIPVDGRLRLDVAALRERIDADVAAGDHPFLVVGTAGSVGTGAVDPLPAMAVLCREKNVWFHVDGAYGGLAAAASAPGDDLRGLAEADSVAVDPHKWLYAPLEAGCTLVRDAGALHRAFSYQPSYYHFAGEATNFVEMGPQNSRGFRALKVWLILRQMGREGCVRLIAEDMALAEVLHRAMSERDDFEPGPRGLSITTFRFVPPDLRGRAAEDGVETYLDELNEEILSRLERSGEAFVSNALVAGRFFLRACVVNFRTELDDVRALPDIAARFGRAADLERRPPGLRKAGGA